MTIPAYVLAALLIAGSAALHPVAVASTVALSLLLRLTLPTRTALIVLAVLVTAQDVGLRVDAAPTARPHREHQNN